MLQATNMASNCLFSTSSYGAVRAPLPTKSRKPAILGLSDVGGITCEHYAFRQPGLDWQVWIQLGDHPLPKKLVLTTTTDDARPQHTQC